MPDTGESSLSNLDTPRSPVSISTESSGHVSFRPIHPEKNSESPTPNSPRTHLTRKHTASLDIETANQPKIGELALNSASISGATISGATIFTSNSTREQVCLCQPDPKIPRPRNAFILYRQHYQAQVVALHPGLANPEISKIIGEQWRDQAPEVKSDWKRLAEEEKQRHQRQYPGYRYQPRRSGKPNGVLPVSSSSTDNPGRCPKCGGQYISTPSTPITPFLGSFGGGGSRNERNERLPPPFTPMSSSRNTPIDRSRPLSQMHPQRVETPRKASAHQQNRLSPYPTQLLHTHHERDEDMDLVTPSPDQKRRRFNNESQRGFPPSSSPISISAPSNFSRNADPYLRNNAPIPVGEYQQQRLPGPSMLGRRGNLGASSSQSPMMQQRHPYPTRSNAFDDSLRLPPLQTQLQASTPSSNSRKDFRLDPRDVQAKSLEAVIMDIPYISKMKVLSKISPPLQQPGPASPAQETRGAVIAVESADKSLLIEVGGLIDYHIRKDNSCSIKSWATSSKRYSRLPTNDTETLDASPSTSMNLSSRTDPEEQDPFIQYLLVMSEWHEYSNEIVKHITTIPKTSPEEIPPTPAPSTGATEVLPIALLRDGFSITISDTYSIRIPISDSYAPIDHWQWMATLWRGIVGPDLVIYAKRVERDEYDRYGGVEIRNDCPAIIVRLLESGRMDEKTSRRLGFEVMEFIKTFEGGFGRC